MSYSIISFDLCGTIADCRAYDELWYRVIPELYSEKRGINFNESMDKIMGLYRSVGPLSLNWYRPSYWIDRLSLDLDLYRMKVKDLHVKVNEDLVNMVRKDHRVILATNVATEVLELTVNLKLFDNIYSCIDMGRPTKDEAFWKSVIKSEGEKPYKILHMGDNYVYDYLIPSIMGIRSRITSFEKVSRDLQRELYANVISH